jgi:glycosyltransferase involved in cell wall biosynthesis
MSTDLIGLRARSPSLISIIINNYNYDRFLRDAIESALNQSYEHTEVIVVDDGSTDTSRDIIASYADRVVPVFKENEGQASAFNAGFTHSHGDIVIFLDSDDMLMPHTAGSVAQVFESEPRTAKVQYRLDVVDATGNPIGRQTPPAELPMPDGDLRHQILHFPDDIRTPPTSGNAFAASTLRQILPVPEALYRSTGADLYLYNLAPLFGLVKSLSEVGGRYRIHGANRYYTSEISTKQMHQTITCSAANHEYLVYHANKLHLANVPRRGSDILSVTFLVNRLASFKLDPTQHPIKGDTTIKLAWLGIIASMRRVDVPVRTRLLYMLWFVAAAGSPRPLTRWLVMNVFYVERRGLLGRLVYR